MRCGIAERVDCFFILLARGEGKLAQGHRMFKDYFAGAIISKLPARAS